MLAFENQPRSNKKSPKLLRKPMRERVYKTLGTSPNNLSVPDDTGSVDFVIIYYLKTMALRMVIHKGN